MFAPVLFVSLIAYPQSPVSLNFSVGVLSVVPVHWLAATVLNVIQPIPLPVAIQQDTILSPPFKSVPPLTAPPANKVRFCPAVAAVVILSIPIVLVAVPPKDKR